MTNTSTMKWIALLSVLPLLVQVSRGYYEGTVQTEWLEDGRRMRLTAPFAYVDPRGKRWTAVLGDTIDGASIPRLAWPIIGGPFEGRYRAASVIHDVGCKKRMENWEAVHETFYVGMLASGVEQWRAKVMFAAVYHFGPRWPRVVVVRGIPRVQTPVARRRALEGADNRSTADIIQVSGSPQNSTFRIRVTPPSERISESAFEQLRNEIAGRDTSTAAGITLDEIRYYRPR